MRIRDAIASMLIKSGKKVTTESISENLIKIAGECYPDKKLPSAVSCLNRLDNGTATYVEIRVADEICKRTGIDHNFLFQKDVE